MKKAKIITLIFLLLFVLGIPDALATYLEELINYNELIVVANLTPSKDKSNYYYNPRTYDCQIVSFIKKDLPQEVTIKNRFEITGEFPHGNPVPVLQRVGDEFKEIDLTVLSPGRDLKPGKYIVFLHLSEYYIGEKKFSEIRNNVYNINENILPYSESLEKEIANIAQSLKQGKVIEETERASLPNKLKLTISISEIKEIKGNYPEFKLNASIKNITDKDVYFYLDRCEIDFWSISVNGEKYFAMSGAIHNHSCLHVNLIKLKSNQSINKELIWAAFPTQHTYTVYEGKVRTIKVGYNLGMTGKPISLESNMLKLE
jgi:hypothetical protein